MRGNEGILWEAKWGKGGEGWYGKRGGIMGGGVEQVRGNEGIRGNEGGEVWGNEGGELGQVRENKKIFLKY